MRDDFSETMKETLADRVGYRCSNPGCRKLTRGPRSDTTRRLSIGVAAHITAASEGGPRYDPSLSSEERRHPDNGIWLCQNCAKLVDNDPERYTVEVLRQWKRQAEQAAFEEIEHGVPPTRLQDYLRQAVRDFEARMYQLAARPGAAPTQPYKFLYPFEMEDADIFFGRDAAAEALHQTILKDRMTVLHARSGAGKTSLLNAGLSPRLIREGRLPVYARVHDDPVRAIKRAIAGPSSAPWPDLLAQLTLHEFLGQACSCLSRQSQELVVILDQFEEFFVFWPERDHRQPFIDALADCYEDKGLPVRFVIAIRADYFSYLATFDSRLPHVFHNQYYLDAMTRDEAMAAITKPVTRLDRTVAYEPVLLETLLDDLARGGMELPHLQIICTWLYEAPTEQGLVLTLASYDDLGRAEGILGGYLKDVLGQLPGKGGPIAQEVLKELVSSEATKRVLSFSTLAVRIETDTEELVDVLARLVNARLLRRDEFAGEITYEMAHEYLILEIETWLEETDMRFKQLEEMLAREVATWRAFGILIPRDRLIWLYDRRHELRGLDEETWRCVIRSALEADFVEVEWATMAGFHDEKILLKALTDVDQRMRHVATHALGRVWKSPEIARLGDEDSFVRLTAAEVLAESVDPKAVEPLLAALRDEDNRVRQAASRALVQIGEPALAPLIACLAGGTRDRRRIAAEALGELGDPRAVKPLSTALEDTDKDVRQAASTALGRIGDPIAVEALLTALRDEHWAVRLAATKSLGDIWEWQEVSDLGDMQGHVRQAAVWELGRTGDPRAVRLLIATLGDDDEQVRQASAKALAGMGELAVESLVAVLGDEDKQVHQAASKALVQIGELAIDPLIACLEGGARNSRCMAAKSLGELGDLRAVNPLITALDDENEAVRQAVSAALGRIGDPGAVEALLTALRDDHWTVRLAATRSLGDIWAWQEVSDLGDTEGHVRRAAAWKLGRADDPRAVKPLIAALSDRDERVQEATVKALERIGTSEALSALEGYVR